VTEELLLLEAAARPLDFNKFLDADGLERVAAAELAGLAIVGRLRYEPVPKVARRRAIRDTAIGVAMAVGLLLALAWVVALHPTPRVTFHATGPSVKTPGSSSLVTSPTAIRGNRNCRFVIETVTDPETQEVEYLPGDRCQGDSTGFSLSGLALVGLIALLIPAVCGLAYFGMRLRRAARAKDFRVVPGPRLEDDLERSLWEATAGGLGCLPSPRAVAVRAIERLFEQGAVEHGPVSGRSVVFHTDRSSTRWIELEQRILTEARAGSPSLATYAVSRLFFASPLGVPAGSSLLLAFSAGDRAGVAELLEPERAPRSDGDPGLVTTLAAIGKELKATIEQKRHAWKDDAGQRRVATSRLFHRSGAINDLVRHA